MKKRRGRWGPLTLFATAVAISCGVAVDTNSLQADCVGDSEFCCAEDEKLCDGVCRARTNPEFGCGRGTTANPSCTPCTLTNARSICDAVGECDIAVCFGGFADCDKLPFNGCEVDLNGDPNHCGSCTARPCSEEIENADPACAQGVCKIGRCDDGFKDCDGLDSNGCETSILDDDFNCGDCTDLAADPPEIFECADGFECRSGECREL